MNSSEYLKYIGKYFIVSAFWDDKEKEYVEILREDESKSFHYNSTHYDLTSTWDIEDFLDDMRNGMIKEISKEEYLIGTIE
jgi:hypothetical protein